MMYDYVCDETKETLRRDFPMSGDIPSKIVENGKEFRRDYGSGRVPAIHIPLHWGDGNNKIDCGRSPSGRKHIW